MICALFEHYLVKNRHAILDASKIYVSPDPRYWNYLGLIEIPDDSFLSLKIDMHNEMIEISEELLFDTIGRVNKFMKAKSHNPRKEVKKYGT